MYSLSRYPPWWSLEKLKILNTVNFIANLIILEPLIIKYIATVANNKIIDNPGYSSAVALLLLL